MPFFLTLESSAALSSSALTLALPLARFLALFDLADAFCVGSALAEGLAFSRVSRGLRAAAPCDSLRPGAVQSVHLFDVTPRRRGSGS